jgi:hypothetical protein
VRAATRELLHRTPPTVKTLRHTSSSAASARSISLLRTIFQSSGRPSARRRKLALSPVAESRCTLSMRYQPFVLSQRLHILCRLHLLAYEKMATFWDLDCLCKTTVQRIHYGRQTRQVLAPTVAGCACGPTAAKELPTPLYDIKLKPNSPQGSIVLRPRRIERSVEPA